MFLAQLTQTHRGRGPGLAALAALLGDVGGRVLDSTSFVVTVGEPVVTRETNGVTLAGFSETSSGSEEDERSGELHDGGGIVRK